jgi:thiol-disulfide isomerase/thioredoxin
VIEITSTHDTASDSTPTRPTIGTPAPAFSTNGWLHRPDPLPRFGDGHVYLINFTAMWCEPCKLVYPVLDSLQTQFASKGLRVIYATVLMGMGEQFMVPVPRDTEIALLPKYFAKHGIKSPVAVFKSVKDVQWRKYADSDDGTMGVPKLVVIDGQGIVRDVFAGWHTAATRAVDSTVHWHGVDTRDRLLADLNRLLQ